MDEDDFQIDDILQNNKKKAKKVDGKAKGDRTELHLCKLLTEHFGKEFSRALGSGSRWSQVANLPEHAKKTLSGDICVPEGFKWVIESKGGYEKDMDAWSAVDGKLSQLDAFIEQVSRDAEYTGRKPILCWKRNRKPWLAAVKSCDLICDNIETTFPCRLQYNNWIVIPLESLLNATQRSFWFEAQS